VLQFTPLVCSLSQTAVWLAGAYLDFTSRFCEETLRKEASFMNPFSLVTRPVRDLWQAIAMPFQALFVVGLCWIINTMTNPGYTWWHWAALGMGIAVLVAWARAARAIAFLLVAFFVGRWVYRKYGDAAKARFDQWMSGGAAESASTASAQNAGTPQNAQDVLRLVGNDAAVRAAGIVH
jgi:hypothetical protein